MLPARRKPPRSGILRAPKRKYPAHRKFVRGHVCLICANQYIVCVFAHISYGIPPEDAAGTGIKAHDAWGVPLCNGCHQFAHDTGHQSAFAFANVDPHKIAVAFASASPCPEIRAKAPEMRAFLARGAER